jgi:MFS family permease
MELPSGALSDRWSRKYVLALNMVFFMANTFLWVIAQDIRLFLLGSLAASVHMALRSGTNTSFLYDTLSQLHESDTYIKTQGNVIFWENILEIIAIIAGGMLAGFFGLELPFWLTLPFSSAAVLLALSLTDPQIHRTTGEMGYWRHILEAGNTLILST